MFLNGAIMNNNYKGFREIRSAPFPKQHNGRNLERTFSYLSGRPTGEILKGHFLTCQACQREKS
jgi:hypothetical protein